MGWWPKIAFTNYSHLSIYESSVWSGFEPFFVVKYHLEHLNETDPEFVHKFLQGIYVDDVTTRFSTVTDCYEFYLKAKVRLLAQEICCWAYHDKGQVFENDRTLPIEYKVLGVNWNPNRDELLFDLTPIKEKIEPTKRNIIGLAAQMYGIMSPITVSFKIFIQKVV